jgi:hypothetical protein
MSEFATDVERTVHRLKSFGLENTASIPVEGLAPMTSACFVSEVRANEAALSNLPVSCPPDVLEFWRIASTARLFEDHQYGQWGLIIMTPENAHSLTIRSRADYPALTETDLVIGEFLADSDLLAVCCDKSIDDYGKVVIVSAIDPREDWCVAAESFGEFLTRYADSRGEKYWE